MSRRTIAVLTTSRADYGLLHRTMRAVAERPDLRLRVIACGSHLERARGLTVREIERDGFRVDARVPSAPRGDDAAAIARALGPAASAFARAYERLRPDLLLVLGDRWELLAACSAAVAARVPIAHVHGGESTEGAIDEQVRHAVTKMAHLHFPAAAPYRRRILQMGEDPRRVVLVGAPGLENLRLLERTPRSELERAIGLDLSRPFAVATCHPETAGEPGLAVLDAALGALDAVGLPTVVTLAGADAGGAALNRRARAWAAARRARAAVAPSLGRVGYPSLVALSAAVIGNSSSGIIEAPSLRVPTVNVGDRQKGRLRAPSVIDCRPTRAAAAAALRRALSASFRRRCDGTNPYDGGASSRRIAAAISRALRDPRLAVKSFRDLPGRIG